MCFDLDRNFVFEFVRFSVSDATRIMANRSKSVILRRSMFDKCSNYLWSTFFIEQQQPQTIRKFVRTSANLRLIDTDRSRRDQVSVVPHPVSKLRLIKPSHSNAESERERKLRLMRIELQSWNHRYWSQNNAEFNQLKKDFIKHELAGKAKSDGGGANDESTLLNANQSHEELALFYKRFLDANRQKHISYNFEWYRRNLQLIFTSLMVQIERLFRPFRRIR